MPLLAKGAGPTGPVVRAATMPASRYGAHPSHRGGIVESRASTLPPSHGGSASYTPPTGGFFDSLYGGARSKSADKSGHNEPEAS